MGRTPTEPFRDFRVRHPMHYPQWRAFRVPALSEHCQASFPTSFLHWRRTSPAINITYFELWEKYP